MAEPQQDQSNVAPATEPRPAARPAPASGGRWLLAFGTAGAVLVLTAAAIVLLGARPTPEALRYIPGDVAIVAELRMDLPGDQFQKIGNLLAHFPGFKDQSTLPAKIDEALGRIVTSTTKGAVDYATQLQPWLAGPVFAGARAGDVSGASRDFLVVATTDGKVTCDAIFKGATATTETYRGVAVEMAAATAAGTEACALDGRYGLIGSIAMVHAGLDAHADHTGIDTQSTYRTARESIAADQLVSVYAGRDAMSGFGAVPSTLGLTPLASDAIGAAISRLPAWTMVALHAEDDGVVLDVVTAAVPAASGGTGSPRPTLPPGSASRIAPLLPADTLAFAELHGAGIAAGNGLAALRTDPTFSGPLSQVDGALTILGGADQLVGWVDDLGIVVVPDGSTVAGGVILMAADDATASAKADQIRGVLSVAGLSGGFTTHDTTVNGTTVTTVDLGDVSTLLQSAGTGLDVPSGHLVLSLAAHGSAVIIGSETFAGRILQEQTAGALADQASYRHALDKVAAKNVGQLYLGATAALSLAENAMPGTQRPQFEDSVKPYVEPFDVILATVSMDNGAVRFRLVATVK